MATRIIFQRREGARLDQREQRRHRIDGSWFTATGEEVVFPAALADISSFGCRLAEVEALEEGGRIRLRLPGAEPVEATVVWWHAGEAGCRFVDPISQALMRSLLPSAV